MLKKGLSFLLVLMMLIGVCSIMPSSVSAQEIDIADEAADTDVSGEGAEADIIEEGSDIELAEEGANLEIADEGAELDSAEVGRTVYEPEIDTQTIRVGGTPCTFYYYIPGSKMRKDVESWDAYIIGDKGCVSVEYDEIRIRYYKFTVRGLKAGTATVIIKEYGYDNISNRSYSKEYRQVITVVSESGAQSLSTPKITGFDSVDSGVKITWGAVSGAAKYRVYYKGSKGWTKMGDTTSTSFVDTDVKSGSTYTYTVRCINSAGTAFTSGYSSAGWKYTYNMAAPKITSMTSSSSGVKITWGAVTNAKKYRVYYKGSKGWTKMADVTGTSYTDSDVSFGSTYTYTVRCIKSDGSRFTSSYNSSGWKHTHYLSTPSISGFESTASGVKIKWNAVSGAAKYRVYYKGSKGWTKLGDTTGTSFTDTDVRVGSTYRYTVRCLNAAANKFTSSYNATGWTYTYNPYLATPKITSAETVSNGVKVTWGAVSGASLYRVYYKGSNGWVKIADTKSTSYVHTNANYGTTYTYTVRCLSDDGKNFISSYDSAGKIHAYLEAPKIWSIYDNDERIHIEWTYRYGANKYYVYRKNGNSWTQIGETVDTWWNDSDVKRGNAYTYTVRAVDTDGSFASYYDTVGWSCSVPRLPVDNRKIKSMELSTSGTLWFDTEGETTSSHTELLVKEGTTWKSLGYSFNASYSSEHILKNTGLVTGKAYTFAVRGVDSKGKEEYDYDPTGVTLTLLEEPQNFDDEIIDGNKVRLSWDPVVGASYYILYIEDIDKTIKVTGNSYVADFSSYDFDLWEAWLYAVGSNGIVKSDSVPNYFWNKQNNLR